MSSRMNRYGESDNSYDTKNSRVNKNKELYDSMMENTLYSPVVDISYNQVVFSNEENTINRENYQKLKEYKSFDNDNKIFPEEESDNKVYDINKVLDDAKKSRKSDETDSNKAEINSKYTKLFVDGSKDELADLINTVTSKKLREQIDNELLGDLMSDDNTIVTEPINDMDDEIIDDTDSENNDQETINEETTLKDNTINEKEEIDKTFFSQTYEVVTTDFEVDEEKIDENEKAEKPKKAQKNYGKIIKKILSILIKIIIIGGIAYFVLNYFQ